MALLISGRLRSCSEVERRSSREEPRDELPRGVSETHKKTAPGRGPDAVCEWGVSFNGSGLHDRRGGLLDAHAAGPAGDPPGDPAVDPVADPAVDRLVGPVVCLPGDHFAGLAAGRRGDFPAECRVARVRSTGSLPVP